MVDIRAKDDLFLPVCPAVHLQPDIVALFGRAVYAAALAGKQRVPPVCRIQPRNGDGPVFQLKRAPPVKRALGRRIGVCQAGRVRPAMPEQLRVVLLRMAAGDIGKKHRLFVQRSRLHHHRRHRAQHIPLAGAGQPPLAELAHDLAAGNAIPLRQERPALHRHAVDTVPLRHFTQRQHQRRLPPLPLPGQVRNIHLPGKRLHFARYLVRPLRQDPIRSGQPSRAAPGVNLDAKAAQQLVLVIDHG